MSRVVTLTEFIARCDIGKEVKKGYRHWYSDEVVKGEIVYGTMFIQPEDQFEKGLVKGHPYLKIEAADGSECQNVGFPPCRSNEKWYFVPVLSGCPPEEVESWCANHQNPSISLTLVVYSDAFEPPWDICNGASFSHQFPVRVISHLFPGFPGCIWASEDPDFPGSPVDPGLWVQYFPMPFPEPPICRTELSYPRSFPLGGGPFSDLTQCPGMPLQFALEAHVVMDGLMEFPIIMDNAFVGVFNTATGQIVAGGPGRGRLTAFIG